MKTFSGAAISIVATIVMSILFLSEFMTFMTTEIVDHLVVDTTRGEPLRINFDITFPHLPCDFVSIDVVDVAGRQVSHVQHSFHKQPVSSDGARGKRESYSTLHRVHEYPLLIAFTILSPSFHAHITYFLCFLLLQPGLGHDIPLFGPTSRVTDIPPPGNICGSCYGAENHEDDCCSTCVDIKQRFKVKGKILPPLSTMPVCIEEYLQEMKDKLVSKQGCRVYGHYSVQKVAGQLRILPGRNEEVARNLARLFRDKPYLEDVNVSQIDVSHRIDSFAFGDTWDGIASPLQGSEKGKFRNSVECSDISDDNGVNSEPNMCFRLSAQAGVRNHVS